jgi:hypothetical protein
MNSAYSSSQEYIAVTISLTTISTLFSPANSSSFGQNFLLSRTASDPLIDSTLVLGKALADAMGNAQINLTQGTSTLAADAAINRIHAAIAAKKQKQSATANALLGILGTSHKVDKTA